MSRITIPEKTYLMCDRCSAQETSDNNPFYDGGTSLRGPQWSRTYQGDAAENNINIDLCSRCSNLFNKWIKSSWEDK